MEWNEKCYYVRDILLEWPHDYFVVLMSYFFIFEKKLLLMRNLAIIFPLKPKFSGKLQRFNANDGSINMPNNS